MENTGKHLDRWNNCLQIISQIVEPQHFETWFKKIRPVSLVDSTLTVEVPSDFFREYLEESYLDVIKKTLKRVIGADARLNYLIRPVTNQMPMRLPEGPGNPPVNKSVGISSYQPSGNPGPFVYPGLQKIQIDPRLLPVYNFSNLVAGDCNRLAISAGNDIALNPGKTPFNPLFIFGGPGLGKTHVANAIGLAIKEKYPDLVVLYVTGNEFKTQYMDAVYVRNKLTDFLAYYMKIDVLIIDDIQDLVGQGNQTAFFNIFNHLHQNSKQLILTSDRSPAELQNFEDRLLSRFKWGLSVELTHPDYATRLAMLKARAFREGMNIGDDVLEYLASNIQTNFRELEGALISLIAHASVERGRTMLELANDITENLVGDEEDSRNRGEQRHHRQGAEGSLRLLQHHQGIPALSFAQAPDSPGPPDFDVSVQEYDNQLLPVLHRRRNRRKGPRYGASRLRHGSRPHGHRQDFQEVRQRS